VRIALVNAERHAGCTLKDVAGGFGTVFSIGTSPLARLLESAKRNIASLPNVTLAYLDALLTEHGAEVRILDVRSFDDLVDADLYLVASSIVESGFEREIAREGKRRFGCRVGVFGSFAAEVPEFYLDDVDFVVKQEIENLAPELAVGVIPEGVVEAGFVPDLDALPFPCWDRFDVSRYRYKIITSRGVTLPMLGSRGCAYTCDYCPYLVNSKYRTRSVASLCAEARYLHDRYGAHGLSFRDPLRIFEKGDALEFAERLERDGLEIRFSMECRSDRLDEELLSLLHRAGLRSLEIGVESAQPATVTDRHRRPPTLEQQERVIAHCHRIGIRVIANFLLGLPNDTAEGMRETVRYAKRLNTFAVQFTVATPYPGTALHREVDEQIFDHDWEHFNGWTNVFQHPTMSPAEIHRLREQAYVSYHLRPRYGWRFLRSVLR
jgi:radical SAM superfamily enzyme YgiQ (UPF0313 family)